MPAKTGRNVHGKGRRKMGSKKRRALRLRRLQKAAGK